MLGTQTEPNMTQPNAFDPEAFSAMVDAMAQVPQGPRFQPLPAGTFPAASLVAWLGLAERAGIPAVRAEVVETLNIDAVLRSDDPQAEGAPQVIARLEAINEGLPVGEMLRWDCCAGFEIKAALSEGRLPEGGECQVGLDPRSFDLLYEFPAESIAVVQRPWVKAQGLDGYPVEFRVYVAQGKIHAVANYYLQRPLPDSPAIQEAVQAAMRSTQALIAQAQQEALAPAMPGQNDPQGDWAGTLDFLVAEDGQVLFLEAGPGWGWGAHPCVFLQPDERTVDLVEGLKLGSGLPTLPL